MVPGNYQGLERRCNKQRVGVLRRSYGHLKDCYEGTAYMGESPWEPKLLKSDTGKVQLTSYTVIMAAFVLLFAIGH